MRRSRHWLLALGILIAPTELLRAQTVEDAKLEASNGRSGDRFGDAVSIHGDLALVGIPWDSHVGLSTVGAAHLFQRDPQGSWIEIEKLRALDEEEDQLFGCSVALFGDRAVVGSYEDDDLGWLSGSCYVFELTPGLGWIQVAKLTASDGGQSDEFGYSVALYGDRILVGAPTADDVGFGSGAGYVFERNSGGDWVEVAKLNAQDGADESGFGHSVSLYGRRALIGAPGSGAAGAAFVFEESGGSWIQTDKLTASDAAPFTHFGWAVSLCGAGALVADPFHDPQSTGAVYVFERQGGVWIEVAMLTSSDGDDESQFGYSVSLQPLRALVGVLHDHEAGPFAGSAHVFERDPLGDWSEVAELSTSVVDSYRYLGTSASLAGDRGLLGAPSADGTQVGSGAAYVYELGLGETYCQSTANSTGAPALLGSAGSVSVAANHVELAASPVPNVAGIFFFGPTAASVAFGNGVRCVGGALLRTSPVLASSNVLSRALDLTTPPLAGNLVSGSTWYAQAWFRDPPAGGAFFNLSSALSIAFEP